MFEQLQVEYNKRTSITNATFFIVDFDSKPDELEITVEEMPRFGRIYLGETPMSQQQQQQQQPTANSKSGNKFYYSDVLEQLVSYRLDDKHAQQDEMRLRISDGLHSTVAKYVITRVFNAKNLPVVEKNEGLQAISGESFFLNFFLFYLSLFIKS